MKITSIKQQIKRAGRYSIFVDEKYSFSLSDDALLASKLVRGQELTADEVEQYKQNSIDDKLYNATLRYLSIRLRSRWELQTYLKRKGASPTLMEDILNKLTKLGYVDDKKFAESFVNDRNLLRPTSRRKLILDLKIKKIPQDIINQAVGSDSAIELENLHKIIERKRRQTKYQDNLKLMQYLASQGFSYGDIKDALKDSED